MIFEAKPIPPPISSGTPPEQQSMSYTIRTKPLDVLPGTGQSREGAPPIEISERLLFYLEDEENPRQKAIWIAEQALEERGYRVRWRTTALLDERLCYVWALLSHAGTTPYSKLIIHYGGEVH